MNRVVKPSNSPLEHAARLRTRDRIVALGQALAHATGSQRDTMAMMLIELAGHQSPEQHAQDRRASAAGPVELLTRLPERWRGRHADDALMALARAWSNLSPEVRPLAAALGRDRWIHAANELSTDSSPSVRLTAIAIAHDSADPALGKLVGTLLSDEAQEVRRAADQAMLRMAMQLLDHLPASLLGESFAKIANTPRTALPADPAVLRLERCTLLAAIADAAWSFASHRCRSPLIAALLLMDRTVSTPLEREIGARMRRLLSERNHPSHAPLRSVLKRTDCPILRDRAFRWLPIASISQAALERLSICDTLVEHEILLRRAHLALRPARASRLSTISKARTHQPTDRMFPTRQDWDTLSEAARLGLLSLRSVVPCDEETRRAQFEPALADESTHVRLRAGALCSPFDLMDFIYDPYAPVARHAGLRWSTLGATPPRIDSPAWSHRVDLASRNARSAHPWVRRIAAEEHARLTLDDPHDPASRHQARRTMHINPSVFARAMRDRLANPMTRLDAITMIRLLRVETRFELDLIGIAQDEQSDAKARASAVAALGRVKSNAAGYVLREALQDCDPRTRANALEVIDLAPSQILELKSDEHHRVRASAVRRVLCDQSGQDIEPTREACSALVDLLQDPQDLRRLAGTWIAQQVMRTTHRQTLGASWAPIIARLEELAANDTDPRVRQRATRCIDQLGFELQHRTPRAHAPGSFIPDEWDVG